MLQLRTTILGFVAVLAFATVANADLIAVSYTGASVSAGFINTVAGGDATTGATTASQSAGTANYYSAETPAKAIDGSTTTKLCISSSALSAGVAGSGANTGFYVTLASATAVSAIRFTTANDCYSHTGGSNTSQYCRTPLTITVEGSNAAGSDLMLGTSWTELYSGTAGLDAVESSYTNGNIVTFTNSTAYASYRILVTATYAASSCTQYSEVTLYSVPEPSTMLLGITGAAGLLMLAWHRRRRNK